MEAVYAELRGLARGYLRRERPDHSLAPTALVHEAYLKLVDQRRVQWHNRAHFFAIAAHAMRRLLVDHARAHGVK
jgi:RNA polymerase sigma-70 factor, ECF subfamily